MLTICTLRCLYANYINHLPLSIPPGIYMSRLSDNALAMCKFFGQLDCHMSDPCALSCGVRLRGVACGVCVIVFLIVLRVCEIVRVLIMMLPLPLLYASSFPSFSSSVCAVSSERICIFSSCLHCPHHTWHESCWTVFTTIVMRATLPNTLPKHHNLHTQTRHAQLKLCIPAQNTAMHHNTHESNTCILL